MVIAALALSALGILASMASVWFAHCTSKIRQQRSLTRFERWTLGL